MGNLGKYAFILGLILAVLAAFLSGMPWIVWLLVILGLIVGFLNVTAGETKGFLLAAIGLLLSATAVQALPYAGPLLTRILANIVLFIAPAILVVSLRSLFEIAKD